MYTDLGYNQMDTYQKLREMGLYALASAYKWRKIISENANAQYTNRQRYTAFCFVFDVQDVDNAVACDFCDQYLVYADNYIKNRIKHYEPQHHFYSRLYYIAELKNQDSIDELKHIIEMNPTPCNQKVADWIAWAQRRIKLIQNRLDYGAQDEYNWRAKDR